MKTKILQLFVSFVVLLFISSCGLDVDTNKNNNTKPGSNLDINNPDNNGNNGNDTENPPVNNSISIANTSGLVINKNKNESCIDITIKTVPENTPYTLSVNNPKFTIKDNKVCFNGTLASQQTETTILTAKMTYNNEDYTDSKPVQAISLTDSEIDQMEFSIKITNQESTLVIDTNSRNKCVDIAVETKPAGYNYTLSSTDEATDSNIIISNNKKFCYYGKLSAGSKKVLNLTATLIDLKGKEHKDVKNVEVFNSEQVPTTPPTSHENDDFNVSASEDNYFIVKFNADKKNMKYYESFQWNFGDGSEVITDKNVNSEQIHLFKKPGTYNVVFKAVGGSGSVCNNLDCGTTQEINISVTIREEKLSMLTDLPNDGNIYIAYYIVGESKGRNFKGTAENKTAYPRVIRMEFRNENNKFFSTNPLDGFLGYKDSEGLSGNKGMYMQVPYYLYNDRLKFKSGSKFFDFENFAIVDPKVSIFGGGFDDYAFVRMNTNNSLKFNLTDTYNSSKHRNIAKFKVFCQTTKDDYNRQCESEFIGFEPKN